MKTLPGLTKCGLFVIAAFCLSANKCDREHNVAFLPNYDEADQIVLRGTEISDEDAGKVMKLLKPSRVQGFYTIKAFEKDVAGPVIGRLPFPSCLQGHGFDPNEVNDGNKVGISRVHFTRWTRVIGLGCVSRCNPQLVRHSRMQPKASAELVKAVKPILQKYQEQK